MLLPLLSLIAALPRPCAALLERWWSQLSATQLQQLIAVVQQFLTVRLYHTQRIDDAVVAATRVLGLVFAANDQLLARGRPGLPFHLFYNDAVNQEVNLKEDYRRWKAGGADEFSFCEHAYVLEPASKSRVLMHDSMVKAPSWQRPSPTPVPPQGAPGGSGWLGAPRKRPARWAPSHCLGCSS